MIKDNGADRVKVFVLYDSVYGNTKQIAQAIGKGFDEHHDVEVIHASTVIKEKSDDVDILIIGSPTHGGRYTEAIQAFFKDMAPDLPKNLSVAAFDTRTSSTGIVGGIEKIFGRAAPRIARDMEKQEWKLLVEPEGFIVKGRKGPLREGELDRAEEWAKTMLKAK